MIPYDQKHIKDSLKGKSEGIQLRFGIKDRESCALLISQDERMHNSLAKTGGRDTVQQTAEPGTGNNKCRPGHSPAERPGRAGRPRLNE